MNREMALRELPDCDDERYESVVLLLLLLLLPFVTVHDNHHHNHATLLKLPMKIAT